MSYSALAIWLATARRQTSAYSLSSSLESANASCSGVRAGSVGRIASWAS